MDRIGTPMAPQAGGVNELQQHTLGAHFQFSPNLLEHLGVAAYNSLKKCLAELSANCYDADATDVYITLPDVIDEASSIEISDNGIGMSPAEIRDQYLLVGRNRRANGGRTALGRRIIGSKGIGKFAGFGVASLIDLETVQDGVGSYLQIDRSDLEDVRSLSEKELTIRSEPSNLRNGTTLRLRKLSNDLELPPLDELRAYLYKAMPRVANFRIYVNEVECTAVDVPGERHDFTQEIPGIGSVNGFYVLTDARQTAPGFAIRVRGRLVTAPQLFGLTTRSHGFFSAEKIVGEINADFLDPEDESGPSLINTSRDGFLEDSPVVKTLRQWVREFIDRILAGVSAKEAERRANSVLETPAIRQRMQALPTHIRGTVNKVVTQIVSKLRNEEEAEVVELVEWILRYYQSNVLRELMRSIMAADSADTTALAGLIEEWGLKQVNNVVETIKDQVDIIKKLEELIFDNATIEADLHRLIERNLWLVREGVELWASDRPLKTILDGRIDELYRTRQNIRPDIVCRSRDEGRRAVVLEFKRSSETITMEHVTQALEYEGLLKANRPNIEFETYVVGKKYDPSVLAVKEKMEAGGLYLLGFQEILQRARLRFEKILEILGR